MKLSLQMKNPNPNSKCHWLLSFCTLYLCCLLFRCICSWLLWSSVAVICSFLSFARYLALTPIRFTPLVFHCWRLQLTPLLPALHSSGLPFNSVPVVHSSSVDSCGLPLLSFTPLDSKLRKILFSAFSILLSLCTFHLVLCVFCLFFYQAYVLKERYRWKRGCREVTPKFIL